MLTSCALVYNFGVFNILQSGNFFFFFSLTMLSFVDIQLKNSFTVTELCQAFSVTVSPGAQRTLWLAFHSFPSACGRPGGLITQIRE